MIIEFLEETNDSGAPEWVWELLLLVSIIPALVYGVLSLAGVPVA
jgi:hypothetical protein